MKFSIVTISFNQAEFLERTIASVLAQTDVDIEYIIVDPGSTDGSRDIIEAYRDRFAHVVLEKDNGPADGLNRGFARASGDIYCYLNADDTFEPGALAQVAAFFDAHPEFDVVCGHAWVIDRHDRRLRRVWSELFKTRFAAAIGVSVQIQPSTFIRREAFLRTNGFNPNNRVHWDGELVIDLFLAGARFGIVDAFLSTYRLHETSITNSGRLAQLSVDAWKPVFERILGRPPRASDAWLKQFFRLYKHLTHPRATWERVCKGPVFNRGVR